MQRFRQRYYSKEKIVWRPSPHYETDPGGFLYADRTWRTKIKPEDLPSWYIYGRFYKCFGYMSAKGITDMVYKPSRFSNHFLKDDCLMIAYGGRITENPRYDAHTFSDYEAYIGWDERVWGSEILDMLIGAREFSGYDISQIAAQIEDKVVYMREQFPDEFGNFQFDVQARLKEGVNRYV